MGEQTSGVGFTGIPPSIYLDYGADKHDCSEQGFEICHRGMRFNSRWQFAIGTQLAIAFSYQDTDGAVRRVDMEATVVDCETIACKCYLTTLLFVEMPANLGA